MQSVSQGWILHWMKGLIQRTPTVSHADENHFRRQGSKYQDPLVNKTPKFPPRGLVPSAIHSTKSWCFCPAGLCGVLWTLGGGFNAQKEPSCAALLFWMVPHNARHPIQNKQQLTPSVLPNAAFQCTFSPNLSRHDSYSVARTLNAPCAQPRQKCRKSRRSRAFQTCINALWPRQLRSARLFKDGTRRRDATRCSTFLPLRPETTET